jgi:hypothetical protein
MQKILFILLLLTAGMHAKAQKQEFLYSYGGVNFDEARDIKETMDKGYLLTGTTASFGQGAASVYMIKTDSLGNHLWSTTQGGSQNDWGYAVELTPDSGFFVAGYSNSFNPSFYYSAYYFKTDKKGKLLWQNSINLANESFIYGSCAMPDSGFLLCGQTYATSSGNADAYLIRVTKNGDTLWTNHYGGVQDEVFNNVSVMNNEVYAVGSNSSHPADTASDGWVVKLDMNGKLLADTFIVLGPHLQETLTDLAPYPGNLFTVCGNTYRPDSNATTGIIMRYDTSLKITDSIIKSLGSSYTKGSIVLFNKVLDISNGNICVIGTTIGGSGGLGMSFLGMNAGGGYILDYSPVDGGTNDDKGYSGIRTSGGKVIGVGSTLSTEQYCANNSLGLQDVFLVRYNYDTITSSGVIPVYNCFADTLPLWAVGIKGIGTNNEVLFYPNPVYDYATIYIKDNFNENLVAKVYSLLGEEFLSISLSIAQSKRLDLSSLPAGSYFLKVLHENGSTLSIRKFMLIH